MKYFFWFEYDDKTYSSPSIDEDERCLCLILPVVALCLLWIGKQIENIIFIQQTTKSNKTTSYLFKN